MRVSWWLPSYVTAALQAEGRALQDESTAAFGSGEDTTRDRLASYSAGADPSVAPTRQVDGATAPETGATAPETGATAPETGATAPETGATAPRAGATAQRAGATAPRAGATDPVTEIEELPIDLKQSEEVYDTMFIKFDRSCVSDLNLSEHYQQALLKVDPAVGRYGFTNVKSASPAALDSDGFAQLLEKRLLDTRDNLGIFHSSSGGGSADAHILAMDAARRKLSPESRMERSSLRRKLAEMDPTDREEEILASLHLLAVSQLVGLDKAEQLLDLEQQGDQKSFNDFLAATDRVGLSDTSNISASRVTEFETLDFLEMHLVKNSVLKEALKPLTAYLPCLEFEAEPDRIKQPLGVLNLASLKRRPARGLESEGKTYAVELPGKDLQAVGEKTSPTQYVFVPPNDPHFDAQWYLKGRAQEEDFGSQVVDGWSSLIRDLQQGGKEPLDASGDDEQVIYRGAGYQNATGTANRRLTDGGGTEYFELPDLLTASRGMTVAVLDSGCSRNPDLVSQFWRNTQTRGCTKDTFVGEKEDSASGTVTGDCVGYDFGNDQPDPTLEIATRIHGSSTSGLIAAEANNDIGIAGVCPQCEIMCLKIYDSERERITMTSVVRALDYIGRKNVRLSNHSYGGFGASQVEKTAHEALARLGHLAVCSSGNNACNLDSTGTGACKNEDGQLLGPFTPATYDVPSILSVGGSTKTGEVAWFSNYGAESVDIFAPGDSIVTLYGPDQLASVKGTSFASPIAAGVAAVLWSAQPHLTNLQVKELLMATGTPVDALQGKAREGRIVSLSRALAADTNADMLFAASHGAPRLVLALLPLLLLTLTH
ncbi:peptidase S8 family domain protein [Gregarina niphandrodes]|uniref:subtilisin n=1 Tax=Gregarina niphandrodes TaxID=110365 RepID=A0A023B1U9_GRENI|nr:peptidase S8 family domain protein [Gregarina niphandrodes]EZG47691.1 peptidase S8 family domain protein [Gregarina niphandrodes]|eukprot:XP_011132144.1 peptidase S8 family domain protein [Gregarina niphandrodes]